MKSMTHVKKLVSVICTFAMILSICAFTPKTASADGVVTPDLALTTGFSDTIHSVTLAAAQGASDVTTLTLNQSGVLCITANSVSLTSAIQMSLYSDAACTQEVGSYLYLSSAYPTDSREYTIPVAGTYYLKTSYSIFSSSTTTPVTINYTAVAFSGEDKTLDAEVPVYTYTNNTNTVYHKITLTKDSAILVGGYSFDLYYDSVYGITVSLYDSNKKQVGNSTYLYDGNSYSNCYVLKKGTYYIGCDESSLYQLMYVSVNTKSSKAGSSKAKAVTLKKGKKVSNTMFPGKKATHWYKVKLTKNAKLTVSTEGIGNNSSYYKLEIIPANPKQTLSGSSTTIDANGQTQGLRSKKKLSAGTYYIKISKTNKSDGIYYTLKAKY